MNENEMMNTMNNVEDSCEVENCDVQNIDFVNESDSVPEDNNVSTESSKPNAGVILALAAAGIGAVVGGRVLIKKTAAKRKNKQLEKLRAEGYTIIEPIVIPEEEDEVDADDGTEEAKEASVGVVDAVKSKFENVKKSKKNKKKG